MRGRGDLTQEDAGLVRVIYIPQNKSTCKSSTCSTFARHDEQEQTVHAFMYVFSPTTGRAYRVEGGG